MHYNYGFGAVQRAADRDGCSWSFVSALQHYHSGFGAVQLAVDRDGGSWSRMGSRQLSHEVEFSSRWILGDFHGRQSMELSS